MDTQNTRITVNYTQTIYGTATYDEEDSAKIRAYMEEANCTIWDAIIDLMLEGEIEGYPEEIGTDLDSDCDYYIVDKIE